MTVSFSGVLTAVVLSAIKLYQHTLSPDHGPLRAYFPAGVCRYQPTCSQYAQAVITSHGLSGVWLAAKRIGRCHPFAASGYDPPPAPRASAPHSHA